MISRRLFLGLHQDVAGANLVDRRRLGNLLVVAGAHVGVGDRAGNFLLDHFAVQRALAQERQALLDAGILVEAIRHRLGDQQLDLQHGHEGGGAALLGRKLRDIAGRRCSWPAPGRPR